MPDGVVIVGTGLAGYGTAREFRKWDRETPLTLISADDGGYYSKPSLSAAFAGGKAPEALVLKDAAAMAAELGAEILTHRRVVSASASAKLLRLDDGREAPYDKLVLAVGAKTRKASLRNEGAPVHSVNNLAQYLDLRRALRPGQSLAILGAGLIGCEFAHDFSAAGFRVSVIGNGKTPLQGLAPESVGQALRKALEGMGVHWKLGASAEAVTRADRGWRLRLPDGGHVDADAILSAIGFDPSLELATELGLRTGKGIQVDKRLRSSHPDIFAVGDCAEIAGRWLPFVMPLNHSAKALGQVLAGKEAEVSFPVMPVLVKTPYFPIAIVPPPADATGAWEERVEADGIEAAFKDAAGGLRGFALAGKRYADRAAWAQRIAPALP